MSSKLRCVQGPLLGQSFLLLPSQTYVLGREIPAHDFRIPILLSSKTVSRIHCEIKSVSNQFVIGDLESSNGIRVNRDKVVEVTLHPNDLIQIGEFTFVFEDEKQNLGEEKSDVMETTSLFKKWKKRVEGIDLSLKILGVLLLGGILLHGMISFTFLSEARHSLFQHSFEIAKRMVFELAEKNKRQLADGSYYLLDCYLFQNQKAEIEKAFLFNEQGKMVCPIGEPSNQDELLRRALVQPEPQDDCEEQIFFGKKDICDLIYPVREKKMGSNQESVVGFARIQYRPNRAVITMQNLQSLRWKSLAIILVFLGVISLLFRVWIRRGIQMATDSVHLAFTGTTFSIEKVKSFAALDPLIDEVNRLISKSNQELRQYSDSIAKEASFLQLILGQVLIMEERAVMALDAQNQVLATSPSLSEVLPLNVKQMNVHLTESIQDTHLQGELVALLNDLSTSNELIERGLSMSDRVIQVRAFPIFIQGNYAAALLVF